MRDRGAGRVSPDYGRCPAAAAAGRGVHCAAAAVELVEPGWSCGAGEGVTSAGSGQLPLEAGGIWSCWCVVVRCGPEGQVCRIMRQGVCPQPVNCVQVRWGWVNCVQVRWASLELFEARSSVEVDIITRM